MTGYKNYQIAYFACLILFVFGFTSILYADYKVREFQANYALYSGGLHVADSTLSFEKSGSFWRWRLATKPKGLYSLFTKSSPYSETTLSQSEGNFRILNILNADEANQKKYENARFNWDSNEIEVQRNGVNSLAELGGQVYDYHSIHLLAAEMLASNLEDASFTFYRKGKLVKSRLKRSGKTELEIQGKLVDLTIFEQTIDGSNSTTRYFYDSHRPALPIKIENKKKGKKTSILLLKSVLAE